jgi:hypothetical protein
MAEGAAMASEDGPSEPRWRVQLAGHEFDLEDLPQWFTSPRLKVVRESDATYWLESADWDHLTEAVGVRAEADRLIPGLNGAARLLKSSYRNVQVGGHVVDRETSSQHAVVVVDTVEVRTKASAVVVRQGGHVVEPPAPPSDAWMNVAAGDADAQEALAIWGSRPRDWVNLYRVYEIVRSRADIVASGWATRSELSRFTRTANDPALGGPDARHGRFATGPQPKAVSLADGVTLIERVLAAWLNSLTP